MRFSDQILALAAQLDHSPAKMYEYVRNHVDFECYLGSRKGSGLTLEHLKGNDYDQASLLIALLRGSGIPARYARGHVKISAEALDRWLGFQNRYTATVMLNTQGFNVELYGSPDTIAAIALDRVWVEAYVPYVDYRGATHDSTGFGWMPIDPVFKDYQSNQPFHVYPELSLNAEQFVDDYYATVRAFTPVQMLREQMLNALTQNHPGASDGDMVWTRAIVPETDGLLPGTLPFELLSYGGAFSEIPGDMRYRLSLILYGDTYLWYDVNLVELASKQLTVSYAGATPADQQMIDDAGGIWFLPNPALVRVAPVLKLDGCEVRRGWGSQVPGKLYSYFDINFTPPTGGPNPLPQIKNLIVPGDYQGIGFDPRDVFPALLEPPATKCGEEYMGQAVHQAALTYLHNSGQAADSLASLMHMHLAKDVCEAIVGNTFAVWVDWSGNPVDLEWTGLVVDADRSGFGPYSTYGDSLKSDFLRLVGAECSVQEHQVFETMFGQEAVSTVKILGLANDQGIGVCKIKSSIAADCAGYNQYPRADQPHRQRAGRGAPSHHPEDGSGVLRLDRHGLDRHRFDDRRGGLRHLRRPEQPRGVRRRGYGPEGLGRRSIAPSNPVSRPHGRDYGRSSRRLLLRRRHPLPDLHVPRHEDHGKGRRRERLP